MSCILWTNKLHMFQSFVAIFGHVLLMLTLPHLGQMRLPVLNPPSLLPFLGIFLLFHLVAFSGSPSKLQPYLWNHLFFLVLKRVFKLMLSTSFPFHGPVYNVHTCVCVCLQLRIHVRGSQSLMSEVFLGCFPFDLPVSPVSAPPPSTVLVGRMLCLLSFYMDAGDQTPVLTLLWQVLYPVG